MMRSNENPENKVRSAIIVCPANEIERKLWLKQALPARKSGEYARTITYSNEKIETSLTKIFSPSGEEVYLEGEKIKKNPEQPPNYITIIGHGGTAGMFFYVSTDPKQDSIYQKILETINQELNSIQKQSTGKIRLQVCYGKESVNGESLLSKINVPDGWTADAPNGLSYIKGNGDYFDIMSQKLFPTDLKYMRRWCTQPNEWSESKDKDAKKPSSFLQDLIKNYSSQPDTVDTRYEYLKGNLS